eukprot:6465592-Amphidinium_carterae.2
MARRRCQIPVLSTSSASTNLPAGAKSVSVLAKVVRVNKKGVMCTDHGVQKFISVSDDIDACETFEVGFTMCLAAQPECKEKSVDRFDASARRTLMRDTS